MERREALGTMILAGAGGVALAGLSGCDKPSPDTIRSVLNLTGKNGSYYGLKQWAKTDEPSAKECAAALSRNIKNVLIPYLDGGDLPSSAQVQEFLASSLFKDLKPVVKDAIIAASLALDAFLPVPGAGTFLKPDEVSYIKAFLTGLSEGCDAFLGAKSIAGPVWLKQK